MINKFIKTFHNFWNYLYPKQIEENSIQVLSNPKEDLEFPNLFIGKIIDGGSIICEVIDLHDDIMHVKILNINSKHIATYLDIDKIYPVFKHSGWDDAEIQVWEFKPEYMNRDSSQIILQWEDKIGWVSDLDC